MFLGVNGGGFMGLGALVNANAISLLKANAYQAAKTVLGPKTSNTILMKAADDYAAFVIPRTSRALSVPEIVRDFNFKRIANKAKDGGSSTVSKMSKVVDTKDWSISGSIFGSIPNLLIYGGLGYVAYRYYKKRGGKFSISKLFKRKSKRSSYRRSVPAPVIGA